MGGGKKGDGARSCTVLALAIAAVTLGAAPAGAAPVVEAHRGGALVDGAAAYPENTLPAFAHAASLGVVWEFDVHVTKDGVPIVIHDDTLDRVTECKGLGPIHTLTLAQVRACPVSWLGRPGESPPLPAIHIDDPALRVAIPTLAGVLAAAKRRRATISPEIKNIPPTDAAGLQAGDFDPTPRFATTVANTLRASGFPQSRMIVQSFWPPNLTVAKLILPRARMSLLTLKALNEAGPLFATLNGWAWVSPDFGGGSGLSPVYVPLAHALGRKVVPYTLDQPAEFRAAAADGVDALITDDPTRALAVLNPA